MPPLKGNVAELGWVFTGGSSAVEHKMRRAKIADYRGKVLVLDFYATWCEPCRASIPHLVALQQQFEKQDFQIIGLNVGGPDDRLRVADFAKELNINYSLGFPDRDLTDVFLSDEDAIPQTFVLSRKGLVVQRFIGYEESTAKALEQIIRDEISKDRP
jgi:cytochrome c biogenesis protein CcmG, thiol:disulfide interchange protein DsbE